MASIPWWAVPATTVATALVVVVALAWMDRSWRDGETQRNGETPDATPDATPDPLSVARARNAFIAAHGDGARLSETERATFDRCVRDGYYDG